MESWWPHDHHLADPELVCPGSRSAEALEVVDPWSEVHPRPRAMRRAPSPPDSPAAPASRPAQLDISDRLCKRCAAGIRGSGSRQRKCRGRRDRQRGVGPPREASGPQRQHAPRGPFRKETGSPSSPMSLGPSLARRPSRTAWRSPRPQTRFTSRSGRPPFDLEVGQTTKWDGHRPVSKSAFWDSALRAHQLGSSDSKGKCRSREKCRRARDLAHASRPTMRK